MIRKQDMKWNDRTISSPVRGAFSAVLMLCGTSWAGTPAPVSLYDAASRSLVVSLEDEERFKYVFNKGGAINGLYDLQIAPTRNLIGESFQGESTDRVIQWTYWNFRYAADPHKTGNRQRSANVTMEGSFHEAATCEVLSTPESGAHSQLVFRSRIRHWFYAELNRHGKPDFETTTTYEVLPDGSLKLTRSVLRRPWKLQNIHVTSWNGSRWTRTDKVMETTLQANHLQPGSFDSYFEGWSPFRRTVLPRQRHGKGAFKRDGYRFWDPADLGGWAMAHSDSLAVAVVFGKKTCVPNKHKTRLVFNKLDLPRSRLNILLPGVETDWPDDSVLTQVLCLVVGNPDDVTLRANQLAPSVPAPTIHEDKTPATYSMRATPNKTPNG